MAQLSNITIADCLSAAWLAHQKGNVFEWLKLNAMIERTVYAYGLPLPADTSVLIGRQGTH